MTEKKHIVALGLHLPDGSILSPEATAALVEKVGGTLENGRIVVTLPVEDPRMQEALKGEISISSSAKDDELYEIWKGLSEDEKLSRIVKVATSLKGEEVPEDDEEARAFLLRALLSKDA